MAFDSLSEKLNKAMRNVVGKGKLTDANMEDMLKEVRLALLEADVNYKIVKEFLEEIREKARGEEVLTAVDADEAVEAAQPVKTRLHINPLNTALFHILIYPLLLA